MTEEYYRVRLTKHPKQNGNVVRFKDGKLEVFAGETPLDEVGCEVKRGYGIKAKPNYFLTKISAKVANDLKESADSWAKTQLYFAPTVHFESVPGTPEWAATHP